MEGQVVGSRKRCVNGSLSEKSQALLSVYSPDPESWLWSQALYLFAKLLRQYCSEFRAEATETIGVQHLFCIK